jgi:hypothetical protein
MGTPFRTDDDWDRRLVTFAGASDQFGIADFVGVRSRCLCVGRVDLARSGDP